MKRENKKPPSLPSDIEIERKKKSSSPSFLLSFLSFLLII
jgi:hypothetical protein